MIVSCAPRRVVGGARIGIRYPGIADYRGARARRLGHAENGSLEVAEIGVERAKQRLARLPVSVLLLGE